MVSSDGQFLAKRKTKDLFNSCFDKNIVLIELLTQVVLAANMKRCFEFKYLLNLNIVYATDKAAEKVKNRKKKKKDNKLRDHLHIILTKDYLKRRCVLNFFL